MQNSLLDILDRIAPFGTFSDSGGPQSEIGGGVKTSRTLLLEM
jgi:hypothetical protein